MKKGDLVRFKQPENHPLFLCMGDRVRFVRDHPKLLAMVEVENAITTQWVHKNEIEIVEEKSVDEQLREAERNKDQSPEKRGEWLNLKLHLGHFSVGQLEFMAHCGDGGALAAGFRREPEFLERVVGLLEFGPRPLFVALAAMSLEVDKLHRSENPNAEEIDAFKEFGLRVAMALDALDAKGVTTPNAWGKDRSSIINKGRVVEAVRETLEETIGASVFETLVAGLRATLPLLAKHEKRISDAVWRELVKWAESGGRKWRPDGHTEDPPSLSPPTPEQLAPVPLMAEGTQQDDAIPEADVYGYDPDFIPVVPGSREFLQTQLEHHQRMTEALQKALQQPDVEAATADFEEFTGRPRREAPFETES